MSATAPVPPPSPDPGMVLAKATLQAATLLGFTGTVLGKVIGLSEASISRIGTGERPLQPSTKEGELAALLVRAYAALDAMVGSDPQRRLAWLTSHNKALNGTPKELVQTVQGLVQVTSYLDSMRAKL
ncbi:antitoxin Xre/MbcA/ParS toxin-binding domain-containing protein [Rhodoferax sp. WC2427]|uniref:antitoxin Xre/MbcA/ParS toxin-binding domain-containing protein n=1 Tax=Rhodoferax sp. WC2427 TaxID=3234144 RepID=UPI0034657A20